MGQGASAGNVPLFGRSFPGGRIPDRYEIINNRTSPHGFSTNYTVTQQGFTADVVCRRRPLYNHTIAVPTLIGTTATHLIENFDPFNHFAGSIVNWVWGSTCPRNSSYTCERY